MHLWKEAFGDSDTFIRLYFDQVYKEENALVTEEGGRVVSALQMIPYTMMYGGEEITVSYISGACTLPSMQNRGLMTQLLQQAFEEMRRRKITVTALIPAEKWLFNYYRKQGYTEVFEYALRVYTRHEYYVPAEGLSVRQTDTADRDVYTYFDRKLRERPACILHSYDDFRTIVSDYKLSGGSLFVASGAGDQPVGVAFVLPPDREKLPEGVLVKEIVCENEAAGKRLLYEITRHYQVLKAVYRIPFREGGTAYPYGMAQVIDTDRMIALWKAQHPGSPLSEGELKGMPVQALTSLLFDYPDRTAYMSLMMD